MCPGHTPEFKAPETHQRICGNDGKNENGLLLQGADNGFLHHFNCFPPVLISSEHVLSSLVKPSAGRRVDVLWMCVSENG